MSKCIVVFLGGLFFECEVLLVFGKVVVDGLCEKGYDVVEIDVGWDFYNQLVEVDLDIVFNVLYGEWGEDGMVQGVLEYFGKFYMYFGVLVLVLVMNKQMVKDVLCVVGIFCLEGMLVNCFEVVKIYVMKLFYVVKLNVQGLLVGVYIVLEGVNCFLAGLVVEMDDLGDEVFVECYVLGWELIVVVMEDWVFVVIEIILNMIFYDYEVKYVVGGFDYILLVKILVEVEKLVMEMVLKVYKILECCGLIWCDFCYDELVEYLLWLFEINIQLGMIFMFLVLEQVQYCGIVFLDFVDWMVENVLC